MKFDIFLSICQTEVDGHKPTEKTMFANFLDQTRLADSLGFGTAWVAETHLSCETQKLSPNAVIPHFKGEIGLNTDILQLAHVVFAATKRIHVGSAIRNILCNGGPIAHAEGLKTFFALRDMVEPESHRRLEFGFASGRFDFSNRPYGIRPRNEAEMKAWPAVRSKALSYASEIFLRLLNGEEFSSADIEPQAVTRWDYRSDEEWKKSGAPAKMAVPLFWEFEKVSVIPKESRLTNLTLTLGSHDPKLQERVNKFRPVGVFNLSITAPKVIEETHERMNRVYHPAGGPWQREYMPRTTMIYVQQNGARAKEIAQKAWENYWLAMEGTVDPQKVADAVKNTVAGEPSEVCDLLLAKYHPQDRLMMWFDFNLHDNEMIKNSMRLFMEQVAPRLS